jgi:cell wall integrity and stress response component
MKAILILLPMAATAVATQLEQSAEDPVIGETTIHGCYSSVGKLQLNESYTFNTQSSCAEVCGGTGAYVAATQGESCYCGSEYPPVSTLVDDSQCDEPCPGYAMDACGGTKTFTVLNTGIKVTVDSSTDDSSSSEVL